MLRTNLSTRPFYNERALHGVLGVTALIVVALTIFNLTQIVLLTRRQSSLSNQATAAETRAAELAGARGRERGRPSTRKQLDAMSERRREANTIIGQRLFSWTDLLNRLENTLPDNVRITALRPSVARDGTITVTMTVSRKASTTSSSSWRTSSRRRPSATSTRGRRTGGRRRRAREPRGEICTCPLGASSTTSAGW